MHRLVARLARGAGPAARRPHVTPALAGAAARPLSSSGGLDTDAGADEVFTSRTRRDNRLRYFVVKERSASALSLLERSVFQIPIVTQEGTTRTLRLPPATVCSKVIHQASGSPELAPRAAEVAESLLLRGVDVDARSMRALVTALARLREFPRALDVAEAWRRAEASRLSALLGAEAPAEDEGSPASVELADALLCVLREAARAARPRAAVEALARVEHLGAPLGPADAELLAGCFARSGQLLAARRMGAWAQQHDLERRPELYRAMLSLPQGLERGWAVARKESRAGGGAFAALPGGAPSSPSSSSAAPRLPSPADLAEHARQVHAEACSAGANASAAYYSALIRLWGAAGDARGVLLSLDEAMDVLAGDLSARDRTRLCRAAFVAASQCAEPELPFALLDRIPGGVRSLAPEAVAPLLAALAEASAREDPRRAADVALQAWEALESGMGGKDAGSAASAAARGAPGSQPHKLTRRAVDPQARADAAFLLAFGGDLDDAWRVLGRTDPGSRPGSLAAAAAATLAPLSPPSTGSLPEPSPNWTLRVALDRALSVLEDEVRKDDMSVDDVSVGAGGAGVASARDGSAAVAVPASLSAASAPSSGSLSAAPPSSSGTLSAAASSSSSPFAAAALLGSPASSLSTLLAARSATEALARSLAVGPPGPHDARDAFALLRARVLLRPPQEPLQAAWLLQVPEEALQVHRGSSGGAHASRVRAATGKAAARGASDAPPPPSAFREPPFIVNPSSSSSPSFAPPSAPSLPSPLPPGAAQSGRAPAGAALARAASHGEAPLVLRGPASGSASAPSNHHGVRAAIDFELLAPLGPTFLGLDGAPSARGAAKRLLRAERRAQDEPGAPKGAKKRRKGKGRGGEEREEGEATEAQAPSPPRGAPETATPPPPPSLPAGTLAALVATLAADGHAVSGLSAFRSAQHLAQRAAKSPSSSAPAPHLWGEALSRALLFAALNVAEPEARRDAVRTALAVAKRGGNQQAWFDERTKQAVAEAAGIA